MFHRLVGRLDYPMVVVTAAARGERGGCLVGFHSQCSIDPPRYTVWISEKNHTYRVATSAPVLAVHFLTPDQLAIAELFGTETGDSVDKFARCGWTAGPGGVPLLDAVPDRFVGRVLDRWTTGDHGAHLLEPLDADADAAATDAWRPLTFGQVRGLDPGHEA